MSLHINQFLDRVKAANPRDRDFVMSMQDAKALTADLAKLLLALHTLHEERQAAPQETTAVEIDGGRF